MHPILFHVGSRPFYSYGLLAVLAMIAGGYIVQRLFRSHAIDPGAALEVTAAAILGGLATTDAATNTSTATASPEPAGHP